MPCKSPIRLPTSARSFYRRQLPSSQVSFTSQEGKRRFRSSLQHGTAEPFYRLISQFQTQDEPAFCGVTTLAMVLNALEIDPRRVWKGRWRWFSESLLSCCVDMEHVKKKGVSMEQVACLAVCNGGSVQMIRDVDVEQVRSTLSKLMRLSGDSEEDEMKFVVASYSRKQLGQTGDGHFSTVAAFHEESDSCLVLDVARFKYPPHWIKLEALVEAMNTIDKDTRRKRGMLLIGKAKDVPKTVVMNVLRTGGLNAADLMRAVYSFLDSEITEDTNIADVALGILEVCKKAEKISPLEIVECRLDLQEELDHPDAGEERTKNILTIMQLIEDLPLYHEVKRNQAITKWIPDHFSHEHGLVYITLFIVLLVVSVEPDHPCGVTRRNVNNDPIAIGSCCLTIKYQKLYGKLTGYDWESTPLALLRELEVLRTQLLSVSSFMKT